MTIYDIEQKSRKELVEIVGIQQDEHMKLCKEIDTLQTQLEESKKQNKHLQGVINTNAMTNAEMGNSLADLAQENRDLNQRLAALESDQDLKVKEFVEMLYEDAHNATVNEECYLLLDALNDYDECTGELSKYRTETSENEPT